MTKSVLDIGNCGPDHASIARMLKKHFSVEITQADQTADAFERLRQKRFDLILVNRKLDCDYSDGLEVIKAIKADPEFATIPIMLVTNHDNYHQEALAVGAEYGFGKLQLSDADTHEKLGKFLR
ncbi:MAG: response regulator [Planctomycetota bacterium]|nr:response regulator [Planctomycetota bacterium]